jgi:hypothetical protein
MAKKPHAAKKIVSDFKSQVKIPALLQAYKATLPAINWLSQYEIDSGVTISSIETLATNSIAFDGLKDLNHKFAMNDIESANKITVPLTSRMGGGFQVVKKINAPELGPVRLWGANVLVDGKVVMPTNRGEQMDMFALYGAQYGTYGVGLAPIEFYQLKHKYVMSDDLIAMAAAVGFDASALTYKGISENNTELRNEEWAPGIEFLVAVYNLGKATYSGFFRELGLMGFTISENAPSHKDQVSTALQSAQILIHGAIIGSVLENMNPFDVILHPGAVLGHPPITFPANSLMAVKKGMSQFILENPNALSKAKIHVTVRTHG